jgi:CheY-like chemotaxis protein
VTKPVKFQEMVDVGFSAFSVFYLQSPSFLAYQKQMKKQQGRDNAESLFGIENIPSDAQIRNLLDPADPQMLGEPFWMTYDRLRTRGHLANFRHVGGTLLCSMDGTRYFSSEKIHCDNCTVYESDDGTSYAHMVVAAVLSTPGRSHVLALEPEFIVPQDGHNKQDCEQQAIKRWVTRNAKRFKPWEVTILTDNLHSHQPLCALLLLVVEYSAQVRELTANVLRAEGYHILAASNGVEALNLATAYIGPIHLLLTDVVMPHMSDQELAEQIKRLQPLIKILYASGYTDDKIAHHGVLAPGIALLRKPFTLERLTQKVRAALDGRT